MHVKFLSHLVSSEILHIPVIGGAVAQHGVKGTATAEINESQQHLWNGNPEPLAKICDKRLRPRDDSLCQIWCKSIHDSFLRKCCA